MIRKLLIILVFVTLIVLGFGYFFDSPPSAPPPPLETVLPPELKEAFEAEKLKNTDSPDPTETPQKKPDTTSKSATQKGIELLTELHGNGHDQMTLNVINHSAKPLNAAIRVGDIYESGANRVMAMENQDITVPAGAATPITFNTVALRIGNQLEDKAYRKSQQETPRLQPLVTYLQQQTSLPSLAVLQTATLLLSENLPLRTFAKFRIAGEAPSLFAGVNPSETYKVDTLEIIEALALLKDAGVNLATLDAPQHPQLKIEALVGLPSHAAAKNFYNLNNQEEWQFWKDTLTKGDSQTRHYALYAIARYYPHVAINMMPDWARNKNLQHPYRIAAIYALGMTDNPQTANMLLILNNELPANSDLQKAAAKAYRYHQQKN